MVALDGFGMGEGEAGHIPKVQVSAANRCFRNVRPRHWKTFGGTGLSANSTAFDGVGLGRGIEKARDRENDLGFGRRGMLH